MSPLSYKTFDSLMDSVEDDLPLFSDSGLIVRRRYIKTARTCNGTLGLKLNQKKRQVLETVNNRAALPDNLMTLIAVVAYPNRDTFCIPTPSRNSLGRYGTEALNKYRPNPRNRVDIDSRTGELVFDFDVEQVEIGYLQHLEDEEGNLLVLDHPLTTAYYDWAIKEALFTNLWHNNDADVVQKLQDARVQHSSARQKATMLVTSPEYKKTRAATRELERQFYQQYIQSFY